MERKKNWKDFQTLADERPDYRAWINCTDPEEAALRKEFLERIQRLGDYAVRVRRAPMPAQIDDAYLSRASAHINQHVTAELFLEMLLEIGLRQESGEALNLLFSFLETYAALLEREYQWCEP